MSEGGTSPHRYAAALCLGLGAGNITRGVEAVALGAAAVFGIAAAASATLSRGLLLLAALVLVGWWWESAARGARSQRAAPAGRHRRANHPRRHGARAPVALRAPRPCAGATVRAVALQRGGTARAPARAVTATGQPDRDRRDRPLAAARAERLRRNHLASPSRRARRPARRSLEGGWSQGRTRRDLGPAASGACGFDRPGPPR